MQLRTKLEVVGIKDSTCEMWILLWEWDLNQWPSDPRDRGLTPWATHGPLLNYVTDQKNGPHNVMYMWTTHTLSLLLILSSMSDSFPACLCTPTPNMGILTLAEATGRQGGAETGRQKGQVDWLPGHYPGWEQDALRAKGNSHTQTHTRTNTREHCH